MRRLLQVTLALCVVSSHLDAQQRPKLNVYISSDMEGIAGLVSGSQVSAGQRDYATGRRLMTAETNAAIAHAFPFVPTKPKPTRNGLRRHYVLHGSTWLIN